MDFWNLLVQLSVLGFMLKFVADVIFKLPLIKDIVNTKGDIAKGTNYKQLGLVVIAFIFCYLTGYRFVIDLMGIKDAPFPQASYYLDVIMTSVILSHYTAFIRGLIRQKSKMKKMEKEIEEIKKNGNTK